MKFNFIHIPKTGGSTFRMNVLENVKVGKKINISMDHNTIYTRDAQNMTFIRHPVERALSHFNEVKNNTKKEMKFKDWFTEEYHNYQTKWLLDKIHVNKTLNNKKFLELKDILSSFLFVGLTEDIDKFLPGLLKKIDLSKLHTNTNVAKKYYKSVEADQVLILRNSMYDLRLYHFVKNGTWRLDDKL